MLSSFAHKKSSNVFNMHKIKYIKITFGLVGAEFLLFEMSTAINQQSVHSKDMAQFLSSEEFISYCKLESHKYSLNFQHLDMP
jgi:hypothetical protein